MAEKKEEPTNQSKSLLTDSDTSNDTEVDPRCKTLVEKDNIVPYQDQLQQLTWHLAILEHKSIQQ